MDILSPAPKYKIEKARLKKWNLHIPEKRFVSFALENLPSASFA